MSSTITTTVHKVGTGSSKTSKKKRKPFSTEGTTLGDANHKYCSDFTSPAACVKKGRPCKWDSKINKCIPEAKQILLNSIIEASQQRLIRNFISSIGPPNRIERPSSAPGSSEKTSAPTLTRSRSYGDSPDPNSVDIQTNLDNLATLEEKFSDNSDFDLSDNSDFDLSDNSDFDLSDDEVENKTTSSSSESAITDDDIDHYIDGIENILNEPSMWERLVSFFSSRFDGTISMITQLLRFMSRILSIGINLGSTVLAGIKALFKAIFSLLKALKKGGDAIVSALGVLQNAFVSLVHMLIPLGEIVLPLLVLILNMLEFLCAYVLGPILRYSPYVASAVVEFVWNSFATLMDGIINIFTSSDRTSGGNQRMPRIRLRNSPIVRLLQDAGMSLEEIRQRRPNYFKGSEFKKSFMGGRRKTRRKTTRKTRRKAIKKQKRKSRKKRKSRRKSRR